jgi:HlyD family secretion protein
MCIRDRYDVTPSLAATSRNDLGVYISASGNISAVDDIKISSQGYGKVEEINCEVGDKVQAGDVLAILDDKTLKNDIEDLENQILAKELEIGTGKFSDDTYYIKSPINGEVKEIKVDSDSDIKETMDKYGYFAIISAVDKMYVVTEAKADFLAVGNEVNIKRSGTVYNGIVDKIENGKTYVLIDTDNISLGKTAYIYGDEYADKVEGTTEYYDYVTVQSTIGEGQVDRVECYTNETVEKGEVLFRISTPSQTMENLYNELDDLKQDLVEKQEMLENNNIVAPVDGIIKEISLEKGMDATEDQNAFTLADTSVWLVKVAVDELDINKIEPSMKVEVTVDAYEKAIDGFVKSISSVGTASGGVTSYDVYVEVQKNDIFKIDMTANAEIEVQFVQNALCVPVEAVRNIADKSFVVVYTNPSEQEVTQKKKELMEAEINAGQLSDKAKTVSDEDIKKLREQAQKNRPEGQSGDARKFADMTKTIGQLNGMKLMNLSIADQLYGQMIEVEVGVINETHAQIISGIDEGTQVILPTSSDSSNSALDAMKKSGMPFMGGMGRK